MIQRSHHQMQFGRIVSHTQTRLSPVTTLASEACKCYCVTIRSLQRYLPKHTACHYFIQLDEQVGSQRPHTTTGVKLTSTTHLSNLSPNALQRRYTGCAVQVHSQASTPVQLQLIPVKALLQPTKPVRHNLGCAIRI